MAKTTSHDASFCAAALLPVLDGSLPFLSSLRVVRKSQAPAPSQSLSYGCKAVRVSWRPLIRIRTAPSLTEQRQSRPRFPESFSAKVFISRPLQWQRPPLTTLLSAQQRCCRSWMAHSPFSAACAWCGKVRLPPQVSHCRMDARRCESVGDL